MLRLQIRLWCDVISYNFVYYNMFAENFRKMPLILLYDYIFFVSLLWSEIRFSKYLNSSTCSIMFIFLMLLTRTFCRCNLLFACWTSFVIVGFPYRPTLHLPTKAVTDICINFQNCLFEYDRNGVKYPLTSRTRVICNLCSNKWTKDERRKKKNKLTVVMRALNGAHAL